MRCALLISVLMSLGYVLLYAVQKGIYRAQRHEEAYTLCEVGDGSRKQFRPIVRVEHLQNVSGFSLNGSAGVPVSSE